MRRYPAALVTPDASNCTVMVMPTPPPSRTASIFSGSSRPVCSICSERTDRAVDDGATVPAAMPAPNACHRFRVIVSSHDERREPKSRSSPLRRKRMPKMISARPSKRYRSIGVEIYLEYGSFVNFTTPYSRISSPSLMFPDRKGVRFFLSRPRAAALRWAEAWQHSTVCN